MPKGIVYMPQAGGQGGGATAGSGSGFTKPTLQDGVADAKTRDSNYAQRITDARNKAQDQNAKLYGETMGKMYDGHRGALEKYRDHLSKKWKSGEYYFNPEEFNQDLAKFQAYVDQAETYYLESYGDPGTASGKGHTFSDIGIRGTEGNANEFYEELGYELRDKDGNIIDEFDWGQDRYDFINSGGFDPNTIEINENGELVAMGADGQTMDIFQMPHIMDGARTFQPDMTSIATQTLYDYARTEDYQSSAKITQSAINNAAPGSKITFHDPTDPNADENGNVTKLVGELTSEQKEMYISDQHWDSKIGTNKFRRRIVDDLFDDLSEEERQAFIETGDLPGADENAKNLRMEEARRRWREVSRLSTAEADVASGNANSFQFSENIVIGGYAVPNTQDVNPSGDAGNTGPSQPYNINRFNTPIKMRSGLATTSGNTQQMDASGKIQTIAGPSDDGSYSIVGAGYSPDGRLVATVSTVVTEMVPEFGYTEDGEPRGQMVSQEKTVVKPIYLTDLNGEAPANGSQELEIYNTITQNPDMGPVLAFQRAQASQALLNDLAQQNPNAGSGPGVYIEGTDNETMDRNINIGATIMEGLPEDVQQEVRQIQDRVLRETDREQVILPRVEGDQVVFFDKEGRRRTDIDPVQLRTTGPSQRGEDASSMQPRAPQAQQVEQQDLQGEVQAPGETPNAEAPTREEVVEARRQQREDVMPEVQTREAQPIETAQQERTVQGETRDFEVIPSTEEELQARQAEGVIRNPSERQLEVAAANVPAAEAIINSEASTPTPEAEFIVANELQNAPEEITTEDIQEMTPVGLALTLLGTNEAENAEVVQAMMDRWVGEGNLDVTTGSGAWCAAFVSSVLADSGYAEILAPVRAGEAYSENDPRRGDDWNYARAQAFESIGAAVAEESARIGDIVVIEGSGGPNTRHVGFFAGYDENGNIKILGGNQGNEVNVTAYDRDRIRAVRRPFEGEPTPGEIAQLSTVVVRDSTSTR